MTPGVSAGEIGMAVEGVWPSDSNMAPGGAPKIHKAFDSTRSHGPQHRHFVW